MTDPSLTPTDPGPDIDDSAGGTHIDGGLASITHINELPNELLLAIVTLAAKGLPYQSPCYRRLCIWLQVCNRWNEVVVSFGASSMVCSFLSSKS